MRLAGCCSGHEKGFAHVFRGMCNLLKQAHEFIFKAPCAIRAQAFFVAYIVKTHLSSVMRSSA